MQIAVLQTHPHLGNYTANIEDLKRLQKQKMTSHEKAVICLTSSFALCGNPWESLESIPAFANRLQTNIATLSDNDYQILAQTLLPQTCDGSHTQAHSTAEENAHIFPHGKPVWQCLGHKQNKIYTETFCELDGLGFFAPHNVRLEDIPNLAIPADANIIYLACAHVFYEGIEEEIENALIRLAKRVSAPVVYVNTVGASDGIVYAGQSMLVDGNGNVLARLKNFEEDFLLFELSATHVSCTPYITEKLDKDETLFRAASLAIKDYAKKCHIKKAVIGISGGMDSALVATLTCEALGAQNVIGLMMPSKYSSDGSVIDASLLLKNLGMTHHTIAIGDVVDTYEATLTPFLNTLPPLDNPANDMTMDNLQARTRGNILMAFANRIGAMVIGTGNKSEAAMGYCTLYGDTVGALEPISDIYKTRVYSVAKWYNTWKNREIIPQNIFDKAPSAELRPGQKDEDTLPPYPLLDRVLEQIMEQGTDPYAVSDPDMDTTTKNLILSRLALSEFKRKQSPFVVSLSACAFGHHWTPPISAKAY